MLSVLKSFAIDRLGVQLDAYTWYRHRLAEKYLVTGTIECLNVGTGGGFETLFLLRNGNAVTTLEIDKDTAERTVQRVIRSGLGSLHTSIVGMSARCLWIASMIRL